MSTPAKRLTVGRGFNRRTTKAGLAAEARFDRLVADYMASVGAKPSTKRTWQVETTAGTLHISTHGNWIATVFDDRDRPAAILGHSYTFDGSKNYSGKWNHHFYHEQLDEGFESFKRQIDAILVKP